MSDEVIIKDSDLVRKFQSLAGSAKNRDKDFDMSLKHIKKLMTQKTCYYTKQKFIENHIEFGRSIDRVDSTKGYTDSNTVACTIKVNGLKANLDLVTLKQIVKGMEAFAKKAAKRKTKTA